METRRAHLVAYLFGGIFLGNAIPHGISGVVGMPFPTPFATPPGRGLSSTTVNVLWSAFNLVVAYGMLARVGRFDLRRTSHALAAGLGALAIALMSAWHFGGLHGAPN